MREFLNNLIERKQSEMDELKKRSNESQDLAEVRAIGETLEKLAEEIAEAKGILKKYKAEIVEILEYDLPLEENLTRNLIIIKKG